MINKEIFNILYSTDANYVMPMTVSITSVFENNQNHDVNVYVFYSSIKPIDELKLKKLSEQYNQRIELIKIDNDIFSEAPTLRWSKEAYYRLLVSEKISTSIDKILYLDCDTIINKDLSGLFNQNFDNYKLIALNEGKNESHRKSMGLSGDGNYYQSGVMFLDLANSREIITYQNSLEIINKIKDFIIAVDQDVINVLFDGKIKNLDSIYNNCGITNFYGKNKDRLLNKVNTNIKEQTVIFHFSTGKPWNNLFSGACEDVWYKYLKLSPFAGLYYKKYSKLKYKILRTGLLKFLFFEYIGLTPYINNLFLKIVSPKKYQKLKKFYRNNIK